MHASRRGTTLLELLVALSLVGIVLGSVGGMLNGLISMSDRVLTESTGATFDAVGERLLRDLLARAELTMDSARQFEGGADSAQFSSWCAMATGGLEPCLVRLRLDSAGIGAELSLRVQSGIEMSPVWSDVETLLFLEGDGSRRRWRTSWARGYSVPAAVAVVVRADTFVFPAGVER